MVILGLSYPGSWDEQAGPSLSATSLFIYTPCLHTASTFLFFYILKHSQDSLALFQTPQSHQNGESIWTSFLYIVSSIECVLYLDTKVTKTVMIQRRSLVFRSVLHYESIWIWMWHSDPLWGTYPLYKRLKGLYQAHLSICIIMRQFLHFSNIFKTKLDLQLSPRS